MRSDTGAGNCWIAAESNDVNKAAVFVEVGAECLDNTFEVAKYAGSKVVPGVGTMVTVYDGIKNFSEKPFAEAVVDQFADYVKGKILPFKDEIDLYQSIVDNETTLSKSIGKGAKSVERAVTYKDPIVELPGNRAGAGGVVIVDRAAGTTTAQETLVVLNNRKEPALSDEEYGIILALMSGSDVNDRTLPVPPGDYDLFTVGDNGYLGISEPVTVTEGEIAVAVVDTSSVDPQPPTVEEGNITAGISPSAVQVNGNAVLTISASELVIPPLRVSIVNHGGALLGIEDQITNQNATVTTRNSKIMADMSFSSAKNYSFLIAVLDALGQEYTTEVSVVVSDQQVPPPTGAVYYEGTTEFADNEDVFWTLDFSAGFKDNGEMGGLIDGTAWAGESFQVSGEFSGIWSGTTFDVPARVNILDNGGVIDTIDVRFGGAIEYLGADIITVTIYEGSTVVNSFDATRRP